MTRLEYQLMRALQGLYAEEMEYARINNLSNPERSHSMIRAKEALDRCESQMDVERANFLEQLRNQKGEHSTAPADKCSGGIVASETDHPLCQTFKMLTGGADREMDAIGVCVGVLSGLPLVAAARVLGYLSVRFVAND